MEEANHFEIKDEDEKKELPVSIDMEHITYDNKNNKFMVEVRTNVKKYNVGTYDKYEDAIGGRNMFLQSGLLFDAEEAKFNEEGKYIYFNKSMRKYMVKAPRNNKSSKCGSLRFEPPPLIS